MSCNVVNEYIKMTEKNIKKYFNLILDKKFDAEIFSHLFKEYVNVRYFNLYERVSKNNENNINRIIINNIEKKKRLFFNSIDKLELLNPLTILKRGYSITYIDNKVINDINKVKINDILTIQLDNGKIIAKTTDIKGE